MGYLLTNDGLDDVLKTLSEKYLLYAPVRYSGEGGFSDTDSIRYGLITSAKDIELREKSQHSFKEALVPISETLFFFTEDSVKQSDSREKDTIIFLRSCDLAAVKRQDEIYLRNGITDSYYQRIRERTFFILIGCDAPFENCFCVDMGTNNEKDYHASIDYRNGAYYMDCKYPQWDELFREHSQMQLDVTAAFVRDTPTHVSIPDSLDTASIVQSPMWDEYDSRCIACGRCNFSCPTCTCFTMQDIFYTDNGKSGERRRVWASCMTDGFTDVAGGGSYRQKYGQRMRFKVLHKVYDYKQRFGYHMCVGCGRCDDVCPEYISFSHAVNKLGQEGEVK